jgi:translation elongation factor EF-Ts
MQKEFNMDVSAEMIHEYRKWYWGDSSPISGGSSVVAIKRALQEANGDFEKARALLCETNDFGNYNVK